MVKTRLLLICGSVRAGSTNAAVLNTAGQLLPDGVTAEIYDGLGELPHFNPDDDGDEPPAAVARLRAAIANADALLFCTPEYAGALPGSLKNLLDWTVGGGQTYGKPVAWINASWASTRAAGAHAELRTVLAYTATVIVEAACAEIPVGRPDVADDQTVRDEQLRQRIAASVDALVAAARQASPGCEAPSSS